MFDRNTKRDVTLEASRENSKPRAILKPRKVQQSTSIQVYLYQLEGKWNCLRLSTKQQTKDTFWINLKCLQEKNRNNFDH